MSVWTSIQVFADWLLRASWQASVLVGLVLLVQRVLGSRLTPAWRCRLWLVVIARLLLPIQIPSPSSVFNLARFPVAAPAAGLRGVATSSAAPRALPGSGGVDRVGDGSRTETGISAIPPAAAVDLPPRRTELSGGIVGPAPVSGIGRVDEIRPRMPLGNARTWWIGIWLAGVVGVLVRTIGQNWVFSRRLLPGSEPVSPEVAETLETCRRRLGVRIPVRALETDQVRSPAVYGFLRPTLLLPRGLVAEFTGKELRHVLLHEMAHVKRRDAAMTWIVAALRGLHWFNPVLWFAFERMRVDRELACDAMVLEAVRDDEARGYGETILRLLEVLNRGAALPGLVGILEDKEQIRERIRAIAAFRRGGGASALAAVLLAGLGWVGLTDAATSPKPMPPVTPLNLTNLLERAENQSWQEDAVWTVPPRGSNVFGGIEFRIDGLIQLSGTGPEGDGKKYRDRVIVPLVVTNGTGSDARVVRLGDGVGALHLIGGASYDAPVGTKIAEVVWRYVDGSFKRSTIEYGVHLRDWWRTPYEVPARLSGPHAKVVWRGTHDTAERWGGKTLRLYRLSLANPEPRRVIRQLEFVSARARPATLILGLTLDPLKPGERPDETPDLEMVDPDPLGRVQVTVVDTDGLSVGGAAIRVNSRLAGQQGSGADYPKGFTTDAQGAVEVLHPGQGVERLQLTVSKEDYASRKVVWDTKTGDVLPTTHTVRLVKSLTIGGTVVDPDGSPVEGAKVSLHRYWMGGENLATKGDQPEFEKQEHVTGPDGRWKARHVPPEILHRIAITASHPDYIQASWVGKYDSESLEQLKAGEAKLTLGRGLEVRGRVLDDAERPIAGATVWAGGRDFPDRQETTSDDEGRFVFRNRKAGSTVFSALAKGRKPADLNRAVSADMGEVVFKLGPGKTIRAVVRNAEGEGLPGARVVLEGAGDIGRTYEFSTRTDSEGRFEWDGAPEEPMQFYFGLSGYEQKRNQVLEPGVENEVVLRRYRTIVGQVIDADTGEPVKRFKLGVGRMPEFTGAHFYSDYPGVTDYAAEDGRFRLEVNEEQTNGLQVDSDDHARALEKLPEPVNDEVRITVKLKPSPGLRGVVLDAAGRPVPGAHVAAVAPSSEFSPVRAGRPTLIAGRLTNRREESVVSSDAEGRFKVPAPPLSGRIVAASAAGFASVPIDVARQADGRVVLQPYGRIEGSLTVLGRPGVGEEFLLRLDGLGIEADFQTQRVTTDGQGRFVFENVPPGDVGVIRLVKTTPNSWAYGPETQVAVPAGGTGRLTIGDSGAVIRGRVRYGAPSDAVELTLAGELVNPAPRIPDGMTQAEIEAYVRSPEWIEGIKKHKRFPVKVNADGSLLLDSVPAGSYTLTVNATVPGGQRFTEKTLATGSIPVTVPEGALPTEAIEVGDIVLRAAETP